jgi:hypothetical protein
VARRDLLGVARADLHAAGVDFVLLAVDAVQVVILVEAAKAARVGSALTQI